MVNKSRLSALLVTLLVAGGPLLSLPLLLPAPALGAPVTSSGSWSDTFELLDEWAGISVRENATIEKGSVVPDMSIDLGTGADGDLEVSKLAYTDTLRTAVSGSVQGGGQSYLPVNSSYGFSAGDEVLIIQMVGGAAGSWEFSRVSDTAVSRITLTGTVRNSYLGTSSSRAQVIRVPQYRSVTVRPGGLLACSPWDGATGGILCFRATGELGVSTGGSIDVSGKGYSGGGSTAGAAAGAGGAAGAAGSPGTNGDTGGASGTGGAGGNGGSGGMGRRGGNGGAGGGAGVAGVKGNAGKPGATSSGTGAGSGQGGSNKGTGDLLNFQMGSGGGGGQGGSGGPGAGGGGGGGGANNPGSVGTAGTAGGAGGTGAAGGAGGGAVMIFARDIRVEGVMRANGLSGQAGLSASAGGAGGAGGNGDSGGGMAPYYFDGGGGGGGTGASGGQGGSGGGGGSGGSIWLTAFNLSLGQNLVGAAGGSGGSGGGGGSGGAGGAGGARGGNSAAAGSPGSTGPAGAAGGSGSTGGSGRIRLDSTFSAGVVSPSAFVVPLPRRAVASVTSVPVGPASLARWNEFRVEYTMPGTSSLTFQLLDAANSSVVGEWLPSGEGRESFNLSALASTSVRLRANLYAGGADAPALDSWGLLWSPNLAPLPPVDLAADEYPSGSPGSMNITSSAPVFSWKFVDNNTDSAQGVFNISVWSGPSGSGTLMWRLQKEGPARTIAYGTGAPAAPLVPGTDYFVIVLTRDVALAGALWSPPVELRFHLNALPGVPGLSSPANGDSGVPRPVELRWNATLDPEGRPVIYDWEVSSTADFGSLRGSGNTTTAADSLDLSPNVLYYWRVRAQDGHSPSNWSPVWSFTVSNNRPPVVSPLPRTALFFGETRELNLTMFASDPEDGNNLTWEAALTGGPGFGSYPPPLSPEVAGRTLRLTAGTVEGTFNVTLKAKDSQKAAGFGILYVTVSYTPPNQPPRLSFNGSAVTGGKILKIDLLKLVRDEEPSTLRWEVLANNSLLRTQISGNTLELAAGNPKTDSQVLVRLRVRDRYNLTDESSAIFTVKAVKGAASEGFPLMWAVGAVAAVIAILALLVMVLARRRAPAPRPTSAPEPAPREPGAAALAPANRKEPAPLVLPSVGAAEPAAFDDEVVMMDDEPPAPGPAAYAPARGIEARPAPAARAPPRPGPAVPARPPAPPMAQPARAVRPPPPRSIPAAEHIPAVPAEDDLPLLEELEPVRPESRVQAPRPTKTASDLDEIMARLNRQR